MTDGTLQEKTDRGMLWPCLCFNSVLSPMSTIYEGIRNALPISLQRISHTIQFCLLIASVVVFLLDLKDYVLCLLNLP